MTSTPTSSANIHVDAIDAMVGSPVVVGGKLTLTAETNPNTNPADKNLQAIATDTQGAGTATAKVGQTAAIIDSPVEAGAAVQLIATENLALSADATTTSNQAKAIATLGTTPRTGESYTNGGILGSDITSNGELYVNSLVNNETTATASSTSNTGGVAAKAKATLSDSFGIVDSNISVGGGSDVNVQNNDVLTSDASTTSDDARATTTRGEVSGIRFSDSQKFQSSGSADIDVEVGTDGKIGTSEIDPNIASAVATVHGTGDARAKLITSSNYGFTGKTGGSASEEVLASQDGAVNGETFNSAVAALLTQSIDEQSTVHVEDLSNTGSGAPEDVRYQLYFSDNISNTEVTSSGSVVVNGGGTATLVGSEVNPNTGGDITADGSGFDISIPEQTAEYNVIVVTGTSDDSATRLAVTSVVENTSGDEVLGATIEINGDGTINAEVANTFTTTADATHGDATATSKTSGGDGADETIGGDLALAKIKGTGIINGAVDNTQTTDATTTNGAAKATSEAGLTKGIRATTINIKNDATIVGAVHSEVTTSASTHGGGNAKATANALRPDKSLTFGGETVGADVDHTTAKGSLTINGQVDSSFDVDAKNTHGAATASTQAQQVTGVLSSIAKGVDVDIDGSATVNQDAMAKTVGGGNAKATITSGPDFNASGGLAMGQLPLDGITGIASTSKINAKGTLNVDGIVDYDGTAVADNTTGNAKAQVGTDLLPLQDMVATLLVDSGGVKSGSDMHISGHSTADTIAKATTHSGKASASVNSDPVKGIKSNAGVLYKAKGDLTLDGQATFTADVDSRSTGTNAYAENSSASADLANTLGVDLSNLDSQQTTNPNQLKAKGDIEVDGTVSTTLNSKALNTTGKSTASTTTSLQKGILISDNAAGAPSYPPSTVVKGRSVDLDGQVTSASTAKAVTHGGGNAIASADAVNPNNVDVRGRNFNTFGGETVGADLDKVVSKSDLDLNGTVLSTYDVDAINTHGSASASSASLQVTGVLSSIAKGVDVDLDGSATVNQNVNAKTVGGGNAKAIITSGPDFPSNAPGPELDGITGIASTSKINAKGTLNVDGIVDYDGTAVADNTTGNAKAQVGTDHLPLQDMVATLLVDSGGVKSGSDMHISGHSTADTIAKATTHSGKASASVNSDPVKGIKSNAGVLYKAKGDLTLDGQATFTADVDSRSTGTNAYAENSSASADLANTLGVDLSNLDSQQTTNPNQLKAKGDIEVDGTVSTTLNSKALNTTGKSTASTTTSLQKGILISDNAAGAPSYPPSTVVKGRSVDLDGQVTSASTAKAVTHGGGNAIASADAVNPNNVDVRGRNFNTFGGETVGADLDKVVSKSDLDLNGTVLSTYDVDAINTHGSASASSASLQVTGVLSSIAKGVDVDLDGSATVNQNVNAKTVGGGNAKAIITSGPDFPSNAPGPELDGITGIASTSKINAKGTLNVDGIVDYDGTAVADNTTGNAKAQVGTDHLPLQDMVATLLVDSGGVKSGSDMHISGTAEVDTISAATTTTGSATASIVSDPVKGIKTIPGVKLQSNGELIIDGLAQVGAQSTATVDGTGQKAKAESNIGNIVGIDMSDLNSVTTSGPIKASSKGDLTFQGIASANLNSTANITTGNAKSESTNSVVVGIIAEKIKSNADGGIIGGAYNTSNASATSVGEHGGHNSAKAIVNNSDTVGINLDEIISISGTGSVVGEGIANGYSQAYGTTAATTAKAEMNAKGILLDNGSDIEIKGSGENLGNVTGSGYVGTPYYNEAGYITLSPFNTEAITTTGNSTSKATFTALGITTDNGMSDSTIKTVNGNITGTGAAVIDTISETKNGQSTAKSTTDIFGIKATNLDIGGSGNTITGYALGNINTEAINTNGNANATSTISNGIGIDGGSSGINATVIGEINGIADISQTVMAKTVTGNATATATSGPVIGIRNTNIYSAGDLTITANASLNSTAYSETIGGM